MKKPTRKNKTYIALSCSLLGLILLGGTFLYLNLPVSREIDTLIFSVPRGESARIIINNLAKKSLVRSTFFAYYYSRFLNLSLKAGTYRLSPAMSTSAILRLIAQGKQEYSRVTVPEGFSLIKIALHLEKEGIVSSTAFLEAARNLSVLSEYGLPGKNAEGFLFPDTYFFPYQTDASLIVEIMVDTFFGKLAALQGVPADAEEVYEKVILASIIEREYRVASEAALISSVFSNRLKIGMGLQSCATIEYIITEIQGKPHPLRLMDSDLAIPSEYNTYLWAGLPPGPISSPGLVALAAAFNPAETHYLYFRLTDTEEGTHSFTRSLDEHIQAGSQLVLKKEAGN